MTIASYSFLGLGAGHDAPEWGPNWRTPRSLAAQQQALAPRIEATEPASRAVR